MSLLPPTCHANTIPITKKIIGANILTLPLLFFFCIINNIQINPNIEVAKPARETVNIRVTKPPIKIALKLTRHIFLRKVNTKVKHIGKQRAANFAKLLECPIVPPGLKIVPTISASRSSPGSLNKG